MSYQTKFMCSATNFVFIVYKFCFYCLFDQQSEYTAFHKLMCCGLSGAVRSPPASGSLTPDYTSVGHLRFSLRGISSLDIVCRSGFGWNCSLARCLLLLSWMTSWTVRMPRSEWIIALVIYHGAFTIVLSSFDWNLWMIAVRLGCTAP
jgi:hypothetical protein